MRSNYETTAVFQVRYQILGWVEEYPNYETTPVWHVCTNNLYIFYIVKQLSLLCKYVYEKVKKQNYKTTLDSIDIVHILKIYDPKLWNYTCLWCVQPNLGRRWVLFKLQNYTCFACMYQKFIWSNLVNYETTLVFEICCQIIGWVEGYPNYETTPVLHICTENLDILYT